jgi:bifunctional DNA-binding transcriptional regulator/antitoxin component of YhaV-PrlF toxin-antitoxin module
MDSTGRLVIPKSVRQALNASEGAIFEAELLGNRIELTLKEETPSKLPRQGNLMIVPRQCVDIDAVNAVEDARRERI